MRVLHVVGNLDAASGGSTSAAFHTCGYLRLHDVDAQLAGTWSEPGAARYITEEWPDLPVHGFRRRTPHHYWHSPALRRWLLASVENFDLVVVNGVFKFPFLDGARAARRKRVPYVVEPHGSLDPYDLRKHRMTKRAYGPLVVRRLLSHAAGVFVTTQRERDRLVTFGAECPVDVVPLAVSPPPAPPDGAKFRRRLGIDERAPVVLFLSRLDPKKGLERLFEATAKLRASQTDLKLVVVGSETDRGYEASLRRRANELGLDGTVVWAGLAVGAERWDAFAAGDVFALPSENENFGIVVVEALLAGTAVVISREVYIADALASAGDVYLCDLDVSSVTTQLEKALAERGKGTSIDASRRVVEQTFSPEAVTLATITTYTDVIARRT